MKKKKQHAKKTIHVLLPEHANAMFIRMIFWLVGVISVTPTLILVFLYFFLKAK